MGARKVGVVGAGRLGWRRGGVGGGRLVGGVAEGVRWRMASLYYCALSAENRWLLTKGANAEVGLLFKNVAVDVLVVCLWSWIVLYCLSWLVILAAPAYADSFVWNFLFPFMFLFLFQSRLWLESRPVSVFPRQIS